MPHEREDETGGHAAQQNQPPQALLPQDATGTRHGLPASEGIEKDLSEPPKDEKEEKNVIDEEAREALRDAANFAIHIADLRAQLIQRLAAIENATFHADNVDNALSSPVVVSNSVVADPAPDARLEKMEDRLTDVTDTAAKAKDSAKQYNVSRYLAALFGISLTATAAIALLEYLTRAANGQPTDDLPPIPPDTLAQIRDIVERWKGQSDTDYWNSFANYVEKNPGALTLADQIVFMNYTIELCPPANPFLWDNAKDKAAMADRLVADSKNGTNLPGLYRSLPALQYQGAALPRAVAADVARLALAWLVPEPAKQARGPSRISRPLGDPAARPAGSPPDGIPVQLQPRLYVAEAAPGIDRAVYARRLYWLFRPPGINNPAALAAAGQYRQPDTSPFVLADAETSIARLSQPAAERVRNLIGQLITAIAAVYPVPAGETIEAASVTCLAEPFADLPAGTVVYVRRTNAALVYFVLPHIVIDTQSGIVSLAGLGGPASAERPRPEAAAVGAAGDAASIALAVAGNLVWALPPPWGPVSAGALTLFQLLLNGEGDKANQFELAVQQLESFIEQRGVDKDATHIKGLADWMQSQIHVLSVTQASNSEYITSTLLPELRKMAAPGDESVYNAIYDLENNLKVPGAFDILVLGVSIYLLALKMIVQLDAQLASTARNNGDDEGFASYTNLWLADYANFVTAVSGFTQDGVTTNGWATRISSHISDFYNARLAQIGEPYRWNLRKWVVVTGGGSTGTSGYWADNWGWTYVDSGAGDTEATNFVADTFSGGDCCHGPARAEHQDQVNQAREAHVNAICLQLQNAYGASFATAQKWAASIYEWNQHLPPRAPATAPTVSDGSGTLPAGNWQDGAQVRYAIAFANERGSSPVGPWSDWKPVTKHAYAVLSNLPADDLKMATQRWIFRQFRKADGTTLTAAIVGIADVKDTAYQDNRQ